MKHFYMLTITNMAAMRNYEVISDKRNVRIWFSGNYTHKWITNLYEC